VLNKQDIHPHTLLLTYGTQCLSFGVIHFSEVLLMYFTFLFFSFTFVTVFFSILLSQLIAGRCFYRLKESYGHLLHLCWNATFRVLHVSVAARI